jgi:DNA mismatch repair ATPase MutS
MEIYKNLKSQFENELQTIKKKYNTISFFRLVSIAAFLFFGYYYLDSKNEIYAFASVFSIISFFILMRFHDKISHQKELKEAIIAINNDEIRYLNRDKTPFDNGVEFNDFNHPYAYDLDIFGEHSLFQNLNRTFTYIGKKTLASQLLKTLSNEEILENQNAIKELSSKISWRQEFMSIAKISKDKKTHYENLLKWNKFNSKPISKVDSFLSFGLPILFLSLIIIYFITKNDVFFNYISTLFIVNLGFSARFLKRIQAENGISGDIDKIVKQYGLMIQKIENEIFESKKLVDFQNIFKTETENTNQNLNKLADLFSRLDSISNLFTTVVFNGTFLFHVHNLKAMIDWKSKNAQNLEKWINIIGEFEMLNSFANFSYNNHEFVFPELNSNHEISFENLSHPLLNPKIRIGNTVDFQPQSFMILTGSNMSGKSTFLRSLGVNMVLSGIGSPVCATKANVHALPVLVSMRLSDSLSDSESYFYAEIKRLKQIMDELQNNRAFVLLDEILRGTNSDDKRSGTIEVVKKMIAKKSIGAIATHDIEVCLTTNEFPNQLTNKCFEVEIVNDDLYFDYKLHDGICKNKSATFLMKKMGVI